MRGTRRSASMIALLAALTMIAAACGGDDNGGDNGGGQGQDGGQEKTLDLAMESFVMNCGYDPTCEFVSFWNMTFTNVVVRPLMNYAHIEGAEGGVVHPDLAAEEPEISEDGLTWTFTIKDGVMFGPPVSREVTSQDVAYAFQRMASQAQGAQYAFYYEGVIDGLEVQEADPLDIDISGIETPDDKTIVFHLTAPTPDFAFRLAMPATAPIPQEVADCFKESGEYGQYVISSSAYMLEGSENLDITSCDTMEPISGFQPEETITLVRNPEYDPETDDPTLRSNNIDRFSVTVNTNVDDIFNKIVAGELDTSPDDPPAEFLREAVGTDQLPINPVDVLWYIAMNLTQPPFDDINVRKAVNQVIDKDGMLRAAGGETVGEIATHILPPGMGGPSSTEYDPYESPGFAGDVEAAKAFMEQSEYDTDGDGLCDAPECSGILMISRNEAPWTEYNPILQDNLASIGIEVELREIAGGTAYERVATSSENIPISAHAGWGKDWPDAATFFEALFTSGAIQPGPGVNNNISLVGITPELNEERKLEIEGNLEDVPSVDEKFEECSLLPLDSGRVECFNELDVELMEEVIPYVPYRWDQEAHLLSEDVTGWEFDQNAGEMSWAHIDVA